MTDDHGSWEPPLPPLFSPTPAPQHPPPARRPRRRLAACPDRDTGPVHPAVCSAAPSTGRMGMSCRVTTRIGTPPFLLSCSLTSQHRVLAHVLYHKGGPRGSHTE